MTNAIIVMERCHRVVELQLVELHTRFGTPLPPVTAEIFCESVALLVASRTNNRKVVGSMPADVVCITVLTGNRLG